MANAGIVKTITGIVNARTPDGQVRQLMAGDMVYENEIIETSAGSRVAIELSNGKTLAMAENGQLVLDETVLAAVDAQDAVVIDAEQLQAALEAGDKIPEEEPAAGNEDEGHDYNLGYYAGDHSRGEVGSRLTPTEYGGTDEIFPDIEGEEEDITPDPALSAIGVVIDETDIVTANTATGTITVDYGTPTGTLALSAAGATWDVASNTLTYQQDGVNIWQIVLNQDTGQFTFEQLAAFDHGPDGNDHNALAGFGVTVLATNSFGNTATTTFTAGIYDDGPSITPTIVEEGNDSEDDISTAAATADPSGILSVEGDETFGPVGKYVSAQELGIDFGTDGPGSVALSMDSNDPNWEWDGTNHVLYYYQGEEGSREVAWQIGLQEEGTSVDKWNFTHDGGPLTINMLSERVGAIIDGDGETSNLDIHIRLFDESGIEVANNDDFSTDPLTGGADGSVHGYDSFLKFADGVLAAGNYTLYVSAYSFYSADPSSDINPDGHSQGDYQITFTGGVTVDTSDGTIVLQEGGVVRGLGTIQEASQYGYYFEQVNPINHPDTSDHNETAAWNVNLTVTDSDTDTAGAVITVAIDDDGPSITVVDGEGISGVYGDETNGMVTGTVSALGLGIDFGTDGEGGISLSVDGGTWDEATQTLTYYQGSVAAWTITLTGNAASGYGYDFTQLTAIDHPTAGDGSNSSHDEPLSWTVSVTAIDGDGDTASANFNVEIRDDGPLITGNEILTAELGIAASSPATIPSDVIGVVTGDADGEFGTDGPGEFFLWDASAAPGEEKTGHILVQDSGDNPVYEIFMDSQTGQWTVYQYQPIDVDTLDFDFRIYDGDADWTESVLQVPVSQFVVGSDPQFKEEAEEGQDPYMDDVEEYVEQDEHEEPSPTTGETRGAILGQDAADVLVGDPGSVEIGSFLNNYIMVMDTSYSMGGTRFADLKTATWRTIETLKDRVNNSTDGTEVKIKLLPFDGAADHNNSPWISFSKVGDTVVVANNLDDQNSSTDDMQEINNWIFNPTNNSNYLHLGNTRTNYFAALTEAQGLVETGFKNHVIFISDGVPNFGGPHDPALSDLLAGDSGAGIPPVDSIRAVGIGSSSSQTVLDLIDTSGSAEVIPDSSGLYNVIEIFIPTEFIPEPTGSDEISGNAGNDLIFGDVLNTDEVSVDPDLQGYNLTGIIGLPKGSGWEVFDVLENADHGSTLSWTRADTIRYIQENHEALALETVIDDQGREGGHDFIQGGEGDDIIYGQEGNDTIFGGDGNDVIDGGTGNDHIDGGGGYDTLLVDSADEGPDGVLDFSNVAHIESIHLNTPNVDQDVKISLNDVLNMTDDNHVLHITGEIGDSVTLTGVGTADGDWEQNSSDPNDPGVFSFTQIVGGSATGPTVTIAPVNDGIDIHVDVDNGGTSFDV